MQSIDPQLHERFRSLTSNGIGETAAAVLLLADIVDTRLFANGDSIDEWTERAITHGIAMGVRKAFDSEYDDVKPVRVVSR